MKAIPTSENSLGIAFCYQNVKCNLHNLDIFENLIDIVG